MLHQDAVEACLTDGLAAEEWLALEGTRTLARAFGVEDVLAHVAAYVWRPHRDRTPLETEPARPLGATEPGLLPFEAYDALRSA